ncbi:adenosine deaminase [Photobacterium sp. WH77]|uniref:adenosine deaminase n=1 Tax=unclassified Photobacterium TaxID=2628852 RepID=UPI001EDA35B0|nr:MULTISPECIES: adenosine deaminase [unclassified Photobacterium]MCG2837500.1 adenosine deaminase [Photobacterium sp. WH77]MCG2845116.1 adenosine deaminase [Photobacterium sp. WH80]
MESFIRTLPKVELHVHIEGTLEPELMFELAQRNQIPLPYASVEEARAAYQFDDLQSFLDMYYLGAAVLQTEQDFYDLTWAYLLHCQQDHVMHTEIFFDPQTHTERGVTFQTVMAGITRALADGEQQLSISSRLIMCFLRHLSEDAAFETLAQAMSYQEYIIGVGLDSSEQGHPPEKFRRVFEKAHEAGFLTVAHAGEEGPASHIRDAMSLLRVSRIDHGVQCSQDPALVEALVRNQMPLTVCPLSNVKLKVFDHMADHNIIELLRKGVCVTINSDDPAYFGGYMTDNFLAVAAAFEVTKEEMALFTANAIRASFLPDEEKAQLQERLEHYLSVQLHPIL